MKSCPHEAPYHRALRDILQSILCVDDFPSDLEIGFSGPGIVGFTFQGDSFMATVVDSGGPFQMTFDKFIDDAGNPVTDADVPTYQSSDASIATVDAAGVITLTKALTALGTTCVVTATFPAQPRGKEFSVAANLIVVAGAAASAQAVLTGPGIIDGA